MNVPSHPATESLLLGATLLLFLLPTARAADTTAPLASNEVVFEEVDGSVAIEAEHFYKQTQNEARSWHVTSSTFEPEVTPDGDPTHVAGASGGAYIESLPDTRRTHGDKLINGENFAPEAGRMAVLHYKLHFNTPGRYYVWARVYSTGTEDNGLHFGLDGEWPASGQRWQTVAKNNWHWDCKQRTQEVHTGVPLQLFLDIDEAGPHELTVAMREDGSEVDRFVLTTKKEDGRPTGLGPATRVQSGTLPDAFPMVAASVANTSAETKSTPQQYPEHWGQPPQIQTRDLVPLPGGYGRGSSTLAKWIEKNLAKDQTPLVEPRQPDGDGSVTISGELKAWHKVTLTLDGPFAHERDREPNPFTDVLMTVSFTHESGDPSYRVPGYFAADGDAANSNAQSGTKWRAHLSPDEPGTWNYSVSMQSGSQLLNDAAANASVLSAYSKSGSFTVAASDKTGRDLRAKGRLQYVGGHYLKFAGSGEYFLKVGPDAPETLLAYVDFDGTEPGRKRDARSGEAAPTQSLHKYEPHLADWNDGDPTWKNGKGKSLIGALNYLASKGCNTFSFLPYNAGGDGDNVWPFASRGAKLHYDCSKLDQWQVVFDHATTLGLHLHFKLQENEIDDNRRGHEAKVGTVEESLDGGKLGLERKLYCREMIARFGYELALLWNIGEENTQSPQEQRDMIRYLHETDPYKHNIVIHTFPDQQDKVYAELLGDKSLLTGASLQNSWSSAHQRTLQWIRASDKAGRPWVVCNDEQNPASDGAPPDPGYQGHDGFAEQGGKKYNLHDIRKFCLWGTLMAGGGGVEYYFGYKLPQNDLVCEDFRSRDRSWDYCRIALDFFRDQQVPFWEMTNADGLVGNESHANDRFCLAKENEQYLVYLPKGGTTELDLTSASGNFQVQWFNPREGGALLEGSVSKVSGGKTVSVGQPPADPKEDWLVIVRRSAD